MKPNSITRIERVKSHSVKMARDHRSSYEYSFPLERGLLQYSQKLVLYTLLFLFVRWL